MATEDPGVQQSTRRRPTLRDIANASGASVKTVSRVVNKEGGVSPDLEERVTAEIDRLGYRPNFAAAALRSTSTATRTIGFVQVDVANPFFAAMFRGIEDVAKERGVLVLTASSDADNSRQDEIVGAFISRRVDGLIVVPAADNIDLLAEEAEHGTPVVFLDLMPPKLVGDVVLSDHFSGGLEATGHLIRHGHRRVGFLCYNDPAEYYSAGERHRGYIEALTQAGIDVDPTLVETRADTPPLGAAALRRLIALSDPPSAVFAADSLAAIGAVQALHELGLETRTALVAYDEIPLADVVKPAITVVQQKPRELGRAAAELLFRRLDGYTGSPQVEVRPVKLLARGSGEIRNETR